MNGPEILEMQPQVTLSGPEMTSHPPRRYYFKHAVCGRDAMPQPGRSRRILARKVPGP
jgi:hypothetical protein